MVCRPCGEVTSVIDDVSQSSGKAQKSFSSLHLEELSRQNGATKEDLERLKVAAFQMYSGIGFVQKSF